MLRVNPRIVIGTLAVLLLGSLSMAAAPSTNPHTIPAGTTVATALNQLRRQGLSVLFSDRLVPPALRLREDLRIDSPRAAAERLLAEHGLQLRSLRPGLFVVVRGAAAAAPETAAPAEPEPLVEVAIYASRYSVESPGAGLTQLTRADVENLAGLDEDALRVAQTLPGTASTPLGARTHVRGGLDDETLVRFDGIPLLAPFHFKDQGSILGSIEPVTIEALDFFSGVFPVRHGDRLSAVMDIHPRSAGNGNHHEIGLSLLAAHALSVGETRVGGEPTRWLASGRSSSAGWVARAADVDGVEIEFSDVLLRGERAVGYWTLVAGLSVLQDELDYRKDDTTTGRERSSAGYRDGTAWLRASHDDAPGRRFEVALARFDSQADRRGEMAGNPLVAGLMTEDRQTRGYFFDLSWRQPGTWSIGVQALDLTSRYDHSIRVAFDPAPAALFVRSATIDRQTMLEAQSRALGAYASRLLNLSSRWRLDLGIRADRRNQPQSATDWSPRIAMEYELAEGRFLRAAAGRTSQGQRADELQVADGEPVFHPVRKAQQWVLGYEQLLADAGAWRIEAYRKQLIDPAPRYENLLNPVALVPEMEVDRRRIAADGGLAYGLELAGRYVLDARWSGFANYTWSEVEDDFGRVRVPRNWNQQHAVMVGLLWRAGPWTLSGQGHWRSGWGRTEFSAVGGGGQTPILGERNRSRWPAQSGLDLRAAWRKQLPSGSLEVTLDINNATNRSNPCCTELRLGAGRLESRTRSWLPRYANVGIVWSLP
jgi:hypothetical protein